VGKKFNAHVAVHKNHVETVWFAPGDPVPAWAADLVGDHVLEGNEDDSVDVRLTDPQYEDDENPTLWPNDLPPSPESAEVDDEEDEDASDEDADEVEDLESLTKKELIALAEERDLDTSGTKADLVERLSK
jgi:hypothetical protein